MRVRRRQAGGRQAAGRRQGLSFEAIGYTPVTHPLHTRYRNTPVCSTVVSVYLGFVCVSEKEAREQINKRRRRKNTHVCLRSKGRSSKDRQVARFEEDFVCHEL